MIRAAQASYSHWVPIHYGGSTQGGTRPQACLPGRSDPSDNAYDRKRQKSLSHKEFGVRGSGRQRWVVHIARGRITRGQYPGGVSLLLNLLLLSNCDAILEGGHHEADQG